MKHRGGDFLAITSSSLHALHSSSTNDHAAGAHTDTMFTLLGAVNQRAELHLTLFSSSSSSSPIAAMLPTVKNGLSKLVGRSSIVSLPGLRTLSATTTATMTTLLQLVPIERKLQVLI